MIDQEYDMRVPQIRINHIESQAQLAYTKLQILKEKLSSESIVHTLTLDDLRRSLDLRSLILDTDSTLVYADPNPQGSFKRKFENEHDERVEAEQSVRQRSALVTLDKRRDVGKHNQQMLREFRAEEEGLQGPKEKFDEALFEKQVRDKIAKVRETDPDRADEIDELMFSQKGELHEQMTAPIVPYEEIKWYPGSP